MKVYNSLRVLIMQIIKYFKRKYLSQELNQMFLDTQLQLNESV